MEIYEYYIYLYKQTKNNNDFINLVENNYMKIKNLDKSLLTYQNFNKDINIVTDEHEIIIKLLNNNLITIRLGSVETSFFLKYFHNKSIISDYHDYTNGIDFYMKRNAGLYYTDSKDKEKVCYWFCNNIDELIKNKNITLTSCYAHMQFDITLYSLYNFKNINLHNWGFLNKILITNLNNKKVLVISNAVDILKKSYNRDLQNVYNIQISKFKKISFIKTPQTTLDSDYPDNNIIITTEKIVSKIIDNYNDFDIILLACGAYGPLITNYLLKKFNKNIVYLGSSIYTMFGVYTKGIPIPNDPIYKKDNFIEVEELCPDICKNIDNGKYWK
jgi:hypothetical protein